MAAEASSSISRYAYHVFLSFRGEDTRKNFTDHLYTALIYAGIRTFRDDDEIERGEDIKSELDTAIKQSRSFVIVMSKDYASSGWCLDELALILEQKRASRDMVLPVFYDVDPSDVRKQTGNLAIAFSEHEDRINGEIDEKVKENLRGKVEGWRAALRKVADLGGLVLQNQADGHESKFIQKIVNTVTSKLDLAVLSVTPYPTGLESHIKVINSWLRDDGSSNVGTMVICGIGGIGKTTIAKAIYNQNFSRFDGSSFIAQIRETENQPNGIVRLQRQLVSDILKWNKERIYNVHEGITKIKDGMCCKKVLVVLDDVEQFNRINEIFGTHWYHPGSKVIITSRQQELLKTDEVCQIHLVNPLDDDEALRLFSRHAFGQDQPIEAYMDQSRRIIQHCGGVPLSLECLGSSLYGESVDIWESELAKLRTNFPEKVFDSLKKSYDSLDYHEKNLFLDIACFFMGKDKDCTVKILEQYDFPIAVSIRNLIRKGLLKVNEDNKFMMHQLHRDMGREIIRRESLKEPGKRSRLWCEKDAFNVLREGTGTDTIEGLSLKSAQSANNTQFEGSPVETTRVGEDSTLKRHCQSLFSWLPVIFSITESDVELESVLRTNAFSQMRKLRLLELNNVTFTGGYGKFPKKLRWLCWHRFPLKFIPNDFPLENMVVLEMHDSSLELLWKRTKILKTLKVLDLSYSRGLKSSPDFSQVPNLERLILKYCINLAGIHESVGDLEKLVLLNLEGCENLSKLPKKIFLLRSLEELILSGCSRLDSMTPDLSEMKSLKVLRASGTN